MYTSNQHRQFRDFPFESLTSYLNNSHYHPQTKLGGGNDFSHVYLSVHKLDGGGAM